MLCSTGHSAQRGSSPDSMTQPHVVCLAQRKIAPGTLVKAVGTPIGTGARVREHRVLRVVSQPGRVNFRRRQATTIVRHNATVSAHARHLVSHELNSMV
jgi:hypothetical protein